MKARTVLMVLIAFTLFTVWDAGAQTGAAKGRARLRGKVVDQQGKPLDAVTIKFYSEQRKAGFEIKTSADGTWTAAGVAGGAWNVDFVKEGYKTKQISTNVSELSYNKPIDLALEKAVPVAAQKPKTPGLDLVQEANKLREAKNYEAAIAKYQEALQANPALVGIYGDIARVYQEMNQPDKAIEAYQTYLQKEPTNQEAKIELASILLEKGNIDEAKKVLVDVNLGAITNPYTIYNLGVGLYNAKESQEAIKYWEKAVALDPKMAEAYLQIGFAYYGLNDHAKAKEAFQKVIELDPSSEAAKNAQEMIDTMK